MTKASNKSTASSEASAAPQKASKGLPPDTSHKVQVDPTNPGRHTLQSKAAERATVARAHLGKMSMSDFTKMSDEELTQMTKDLGVRLRVATAKGEPTREDYIAALKGLLPEAVKKASRA